VRAKSLRAAIRPAIAEADGLVSAGGLTIGILHGDPHQAAFRVDERGGVGLLDWDSAVAGPLLYDVASVAMYGGVSPTDPETALLRGYLEEAPTDVAELRHAKGSCACASRFRPCTSAGVRRRASRRVAKRTGATGRVSRTRSAG